MDLDGNVYNTVTIGTQCRITENLKTTRYNDDSPIPKVSDFWTWSNLITPACCWYHNDPLPTGFHMMPYVIGKQWPQESYVMRNGMYLQIVSGLS
jgi:hypothetical protein